MPGPQELQGCWQLSKKLAVERTKGQQAGKNPLNGFLAQILGFQGIAWGSPTYIRAGGSRAFMESVGLKWILKDERDLCK